MSKATESYRKVLRFADGDFIIDGYKDGQHIISLGDNDDYKVILAISTDELIELSEAIIGALDYAAPAPESGQP